MTDNLEKTVCSSFECKGPSGDHPYRIPAVVVVINGRISVRCPKYSSGICIRDDLHPNNQGKRCPYV